VHERHWVNLLLVALALHLVDLGALVLVLDVATRLGLLLLLLFGHLFVHALDRVVRGSLDLVREYADLNVAIYRREKRKLRES